MAFLGAWNSYLWPSIVLLDEGKYTLPMGLANMVSIQNDKSDYGALMADMSLKDKDASHNFRWIACGGGAGEVIAHLDHFEPPAGRCERTRSASNQ